MWIIKRFIYFLPFCAAIICTLVISKTEQFHLQPSSLSLIYRTSSREKNLVFFFFLHLLFRWMSIPKPNDHCIWVCIHVCLCARERETFIPTQNWLLKTFKKKRKKESHTSESNGIQARKNRTLRNRITFFFVGSKCSKAKR